MPIPGPTLEWENYVVAMTMQSLLGLVSPKMLGVAVKVEGATVSLYFVVSTDDDEIKEDIEDVIGDLEAFMIDDSLPSGPSIVSHVHVYKADEVWEGKKYRQVFAAKLP